MVVIRLARAGSKKSPFYHIVVAHKRDSRDGRFIERIGFYNPVAKGKAPTHRLSLERADDWIGKGAQASDTVARLITKVRKEGNPEAATA